jgi:hypothetical protein
MLSHVDGQQFFIECGERGTDQSRRLVAIQRPECQIGNFQKTGDYRANQNNRARN